MSTEVTDDEIEKELLELLRKGLELNKHGLFTIKQFCKLCKYNQKTLNISDEDDQRRVLTGFYDLFLKGYLSWGHNFEKPKPPLFHITHRGKDMLKRDI